MRLNGAGEVVDDDQDLQQALEDAGDEDTKGADAKEGDQEEDEDPEEVLVTRFGGDSTAAVRALRETEKKAAGADTEIKSYRQKLQEAGYTFDADGNPVAPKRDEPDKPLQSDGAVERYADGSYKGADGLVYEKTGALRMTPEDWKNTAEFLKKTRPDDWEDALKEAKDSHIAQSEARKVIYESQVAQAATTQYNTERYEMETFFASVPELKDNPVLKQALKDGEKVYKAQDKEFQAQPGAYYGAVMFALGPQYQDFFKSVVEQAANAGAETATKDKRTIATQSGGRGQQEPAPKGGAATTKLTAAERVMAKKLGMTEEEYAANRD